jgi:2-oxoisovalerate dehydrogenase E1 component
MPCGGGLTFGSFHSQELESFFLSMPGIKALYPSNPQDAFNALLAASEDNNPVILFEHKGLYRAASTRSPGTRTTASVWRPKRVRVGGFATLVTYGEKWSTWRPRPATTSPPSTSADIEVFDLRCLSPLDLTADRPRLRARAGSSCSTRAGRTHGFGAEIVARIAGETAASALKAPPLRIAGPRPARALRPELEAAFRPTKDQVIELITGWMS